jgi:hypothetical protein
MKIKISTVLWFAFFLFIGYYFFYAPYRFEKKLKENGIVATGILLKTEETGTSFNDKPEMDLFFEVTNAKGEKWKATATQVISFSDLYKLVPGNDFNIRYNPEDKTEIIVSE